MRRSKVGRSEEVPPGGRGNATSLCRGAGTGRMNAARLRHHHSIKKAAIMKISTRNQLKGTIVEVTKGQTTAHVRIDIGGGVIVTSSITNESVDSLGLKAGQSAYAVIKASDVMVGLD